MDKNDQSSRFRGDNDRDRRGDNERDRRGDNDRDRRTARSNRECVICKSSGRQYRDHFFSDCRFLPEGDRRYISTLRARAGNIESDDEIDEDDEHYIESTGSSARSVATVQDQNIDVSISARRVPVVSSPFINCHYKHHTIRITIDSGATGNIIRLNVVLRVKAVMRKNTQRSNQADGHSHLDIVGKLR